MMKRPPLLRPTRVALLLSLAALLAAPLVAQVDDEVIAGVQFNFTPPGARSLGLGGAFLAIANDATAAYTNPAGITNLTQQEISVEGRSFSSSTSFTLGGRAECGASGCVGDTASGFGFDNRNGLVFGETDDDTTGLSFISYVVPVGQARLAFYRHELVNFESAFRSDGPFVELTELGGCDIDTLDVDGCFRLFPVDTEIGLDIENFGASFAYEFGTFSIGVGANFYQFDIASVTDRFGFSFSNVLEENALPGFFFGPPDFGPANVFASQVQTGDDDAVGVNVGFLWDVGPRFSIGGAFRDGVDFQYDYVITCGPADPDTCRQIDGLAGGTKQTEATFNVPTVWGVGIAFRPLDNLTISIDYDNVEYSALVDDFTIFADLANNPADFQVDDADELHVGLEYVFVNLRNPISIRLGAWEDPAHRIRYVGDQPATSVILWSGSNLAEDETHVSAGLGFVFGERFGIDVAGDFSENADIAALSAVLRF